LNVKRSKRYQENKEKTEPLRRYTLAEAVALLQQMNPAKFDESVEAHVRLGIDSRKADQQVRTTVVLPGGTGKEVRVLVFAKGEKEQEALAAGADYIADEEMISKIQGGWTDFDVAVATPDMMREVGKLGKLLGPRGLMPNPKAGTVTMDVGAAVQELKKGRVEIRVDKTNIAHNLVGKVSFTSEVLVDNTLALLQAIARAKPAVVAGRGQYVKGLTLATTMGPGLAVEMNDLWERIGL